MNRSIVVETRVLLETVKHYEKGKNWTWCYHEKDLLDPVTPPGKLKILQDHGYVKFKASLCNCNREGETGVFQIDSMILTPEGEALLREHHSRSLSRRLLNLLSTIAVSAITSVVTVILMKLLKLV